MDNLNLKIEYIDVDKLTPYERNTRKHTDKDIDIIAKSIEKYGFNDAIGIWGKKNIVVEGHGRLLAAKKLGMDKVPCVRLDHLTEQERREYAIAHNRSAEMSEWDYDFLPEEYEELDFEGFDFGFDFDDETNHISPDDFSEEFSLPDGEKPETVYLSMVLNINQKNLIDEIIGEITPSETFGNTNKLGNAMYEVCKQWKAQRI